MSGHYVYKLLPPRASFGMDMNEAEAQIMADHAAYWQPYIDDVRAGVG